MKFIFRLAALALVAVGARRLLKGHRPQVERLVERLPGPLGAPVDGRKQPWVKHTSTHLNSTEVPPSQVAQSQHTEPMKNSEQVVDPAHTAR